MSSQPPLRDYLQLIHSQQTLILSTLNSQGLPESSYAPYVRDEQGTLYIFVSDLASHTQNMLNRGRVSAMIIQDEKDCKNPFARERVIFDCDVIEIEAGNEHFKQHLSAMWEKFGDTVALLQSLSDFHFLALKPISGKYIAGFGQTYAIHIDENGVC